MYLQFYGLREFPYALGCDERYFYESRRHAEALARMLYTIEHRRGILLVTGEVGAGKTFLTRLLGRRLGMKTQLVTICHPPDSARQLLRAVAGGLGVVVAPASDKQTLIEVVEKQLRLLHQRQRTVVLLLDEAQSLGDELLEEVRLMWNWEADGQPLLQIVLMAQPEIRRRLRDPRWASLAQRITLSCHLGPLDAEDTCRYILHRRRIAKDDVCTLKFTQEAVAEVYRATRGIPRLINILCDHVLLVGYARNEHVITRAIVAEVLRDMTCWDLKPPASEPAGAASAGAASAGAAAPPRAAAPLGD